MSSYQLRCTPYYNYPVICPPQRNYLLIPSLATALLQFALLRGSNTTAINSRWANRHQARDELKVWMDAFEYTYVNDVEIWKIKNLTVINKERLLLGCKESSLLPPECCIHPLNANPTATNSH